MSYWQNAPFEVLSEACMQQHAGRLLRMYLPALLVMIDQEHGRVRLECALTHRRWGEQGQWQPALIYDTATGLPPPQHAYWSTHYQHNPRAPENVTPAPWVSVRASHKANHS